MILYETIDTEAKRLATLSGYQILDTDAEREFDDLAILAATVCQTPIALVVFVDQNRQWFKSRIGLDVLETPRAVAFCHHAIQKKSILIVRDALEDPRFQTNPLVLSDPKIRFYAGCPLITPEDNVIGTLCVIDQVPRDLSEGQRYALEALARQVVSQLELRRRLRIERCFNTELEQRVAERTQRLEEALDQAQSANRMKSSFLANMSHEIRTPLCAMMGFTDLLKDTHTTEKDRNTYLEIITKSGKHLQGLLNDVLDFSKIESGFLRVERIKFHPRVLLHEVTSLLNIDAGDKGVELTCEVDPGVPESVVSDPYRLRQILLNIIGNAVKFTQKGKVKVRVRYEGAKTPTPLIKFMVEDTGIGITPHHISRLFKSFSQADETMARKHGGTGLGLVLSKRLSSLLGGDVVLASTEPGKGSTFVISIRDYLEGESLDSNQETPAEPIGRDTLKTMRILVIDDARENQELMVRVLDRYGAIVETASNGKEGIERAIADDYDVVLMDLQMPVLDGYVATRHLRRLGYNKPIIALTAHAIPENRELCGTSEFDAYLAKPIDIRELVRAVRRTLPVQAPVTH